MCLILLARVDKEGENPRDVIIDPPNITTKPVKKGPAIDKVLFSKPDHIAVGEPYKVPISGVLARKEDRQAQIAAGNEKPFKPQTSAKERIYRASYKHMTDFTEIQKNYRDEENPRDVVIGPPNMRTNPMKRGKSGKQVFFGGKVPYMEDDYNRPKYFAAAEREYHQAMLQEKPFSQ